jgi:hypothetical protein
MQHPDSIDALKGEPKAQSCDIAFEQLSPTVERDDTARFYTKLRERCPQREVVGIVDASLQPSCFVGLSVACLVTPAQLYMVRKKRPYWILATADPFSRFCNIATSASIPVCRAGSTSGANNDE